MQQNSPTCSTVSAVDGSGPRSGKAAEGVRSLRSISSPEKPDPAANVGKHLGLRGYRRSFRSRKASSSGRPLGDQWHHLRDPQQAALTRCSAKLRAAQDNLQPLHALERLGRVRALRRRACQGRRRDGGTDDRCRASGSPLVREQLARAPQGAPDCSQPAQRGALPRHIGRTKNGLNSKLHAVCDSQGRPRSLLLTVGQISDYTGAAALLQTMPPAEVLGRPGL